MSEVGLTALYANQVARTIVRMDDRLSKKKKKFFLMTCDLSTIPLRRPVDRDRRIGHPRARATSLRILFLRKGEGGSSNQSGFEGFFL